MQTRLEGTLWLHREQQRLLGAERLALLERIAELGSISAAAKAQGMSYRAAWDAVTDMNNLAEAPLTRNLPGGPGGGGTRLTDYGRRLITVFRTLESEYARVLDGLNTGLGDWDELLRLMGRLSMRTSARNQLQGKVLAVNTGPVNAEVTLALNAVDRLVAVVTRESVEALKLAPGRQAYALIKSSFLILTTADGGFDTSARNRLCGTVRRIARGTVSVEVVLELDGGKTLAAMVTDDSVRALGLEEGMRAGVLVKASHVILGVN